MKIVVGLVVWLAFCAPSLWAQTTELPVETTICEITQHPTKFYGKRVRVSVQHVADRTGGNAMTDFPGMLNIKRSSVSEEPCVVAYKRAANFSGKLQFANDKIPVFIGIINGVPHIGFWGGYASVVGIVHFNPKPQMKPRIVRDENGKIVEVNFWQPDLTGLPDNSLRLRIDVESFSDF